MSKRDIYLKNKIKSITLRTFDSTPFKFTFKFILLLIIIFSLILTESFGLSHTHNLDLKFIQSHFKVEKFYIGNLTTGKHIKIGYRFYNNLNSTVRIFIQDKNIIGNSGLDIKCLELNIPPNASEYLYERMILLTQSGTFILPSANITLVLGNKSYLLKSNNLTLDIKGKDIQGNFITSIYQCNGVKRISSSYASSATHIIINNGNVYVGNGMNNLNPFDSDPFDNLDEIDQYFNRQIQQMHKQMQQIMNAFFPHQQNPQYTPLINQNANQNLPNTQNNKNTGNPNTQSTNHQQSIYQNTNAKNMNSNSGHTIKNSNSINKASYSKKNPLIPQRFVNATTKKHSLLVTLIRLLLLGIIIGLIIAFVKLSKSHPLELENVESSKALELYNEIKNELKEIESLSKRTLSNKANKIKTKKSRNIKIHENDELQNEVNKIFDDKKIKSKILKFKEKVAEFKDALINEFSEIIDDDIIDEIEMYLYANKIDSIKKVIDKLDQIFIQKE